ncbi:expressed unknown protein [Seminavis robusta]|uniref:Uncharacterized protein n=1 Tax=Seminavis robusta TaxID=568900 RepID=A0A9N8HFW6_9STRA|nr:expressed unknown protein [Seminavis robusta]|eukprot:Sro454_g146330.1 n/a (476) ;mRNA; r:28032-29555
MTTTTPTTTTFETKVYDVTYKGEPGRLTLANKFFHYEANFIEATIKCSWARVDRRQLSPPGADNYLIKLVLASGKTAVFEVETLPILLKLVKDVKARMEANKPKEDSEEQAKKPEAFQDEEETKRQKKKNRFSVNTEYISMKDLSKDPSTENSTEGPDNNDVEQGKQPDDKDNKDNKDKMKDASHRRSQLRRSNRANSRRRNSSKGPHPPVLAGQDPYLSQAHDKRDDSRRTICYCPWDSVWCWMCLCVFLALVVTIIVLVVLFVIPNDNNNNNNPWIRNYQPKQGPLCKDVTDDLSKCPPDDGMEYRYGIRSVEYNWGPDNVRLEYAISDYILDTSMDFFVMDGVNCRGSDDKNVPKETPWLKFQLVDGAPEDGGPNVYNEGRGTRQFDIDIDLLASSNQLATAPFYFPNTAGDNKAFLRLCVNFQVFYNRLEGFTERKEVNYIENALELNMDVSNPLPVITDVLVKTVTRPSY